MEYQEMFDFSSENSRQIIKDPQNAFDAFKKMWIQLTIEDKLLVEPEIKKFCSNWMDNEEVNPLVDSDQNIIRFCCRKIYNYINDDLGGKPDFGNLKLGKGIKSVDIAVAFKLLYALNYFDNTLEELEKVIIRVFNLPANESITSYLNDNAKLETAAKKLKKKIEDSLLTRT